MKEAEKASWDLANIGLENRGKVAKLFMITIADVLLVSHSVILDNKKLEGKKRQNSLSVQI
jgi:hypothetical protein